MTTGTIVPLPESEIAPIIGHSYSHKQSVFLSEMGTEVFFGGALAGGKTQALIAAALQFAHVPGYHAIIFRRTRPNCQDLIDRLVEMLGGHAKYVSGLRGGRFTMRKSGAIIDIGYAQHPNDIMNYKGPEFQLIAWDELTEFVESQYRYMFSRLRVSECSKHKTHIDNTCIECKRRSLLSKVPKRVRSASNPDGLGRAWVKKQFVSENAEEEIEADVAKDRYLNGSAIFIPSRVNDNPGIDAESYREETAKRMTPVQVRQLFGGSWKAMEGTIFNESMFRFYQVHETGTLKAMRHGTNSTLFTAVPTNIKRFATIDTAHTSEEKAREARGKPPSYSVISIWDGCNQAKSGRAMFLRAIWRKRVDWLELRSETIQFLNKWSPSAVVIEDTIGARSLIAECRQEGWNVVPFNPRQKRFTSGQGKSAKLERSHELQVQMNDGRVYFPENRNSVWLADYFGEILSWTGLEDETADQVDVSSMAALYWFQGKATKGKSLLKVNIPTRKSGEKEDHLRWKSILK
jgi:hypothetical protein